MSSNGTLFLPLSILPFLAAVSVRVDLQQQLSGSAAGDEPLLRYNQVSQDCEPLSLKSGELLHRMLAELRGGM